MIFLDNSKKMLTEDDLKKLADLFYSNSVFMSSLTRWTNKAQELLPDIPVKELRLFYENQTLTQMFRPRITSVSRSGQVRRPIINNVPFRRVYADTMFFKRDGFGLICFVDGFSKLGYVYYVPLPKDTTVAGRDGAEALFQFIKYHEENYPQFPIGAIYRDAGSEFTDAFERVRLKYLPNARNEIAEIGGILKNPIAERFNYSLRLMIEKFRETFKPRKITEKMVNKIVENYNSIPSSSLKGLSPAEALQNVDDALERIKSRRTAKNYTNIEGKFPVGSYVRTIRDDKKLSNPYAKTLKANWSEAVRQIDGFDRKKQRFEVNGKLYGDWELIKVDKKLLDDYDMFRKKVHDITTVSKDVVRVNRTLNADDVEQFIIEAYTSLKPQQRYLADEVAGFSIKRKTDGTIERSGNTSSRAGARLVDNVISKAKKEGRLMDVARYLGFTGA